MYRLISISSHLLLACFADNLFVIDSTSSVREIFEQHRAYVENVANALAIGENGHHVGVIEYASQKRHFVKISLADKQKKESVLKRIQSKGFMKLKNGKINGGCNRVFVKKSKNSKNGAFSPRSL